MRWRWIEIETVGKTPNTHSTAMKPPFKPATTELTNSPVVRHNPLSPDCMYFLAGKGVAGEKCRPKPNLVNNRLATLPCYVLHPIIEFLDSGRPL